MSQLQKVSDILSSSLSCHISLEDMTQGFAKWKESTNISPLTRRLGHLKFFVVLDECDSNPDHFYINQHMLQTINTIINAAKEAGTPLRKWFSSTVVMI